MKHLHFQFIAASCGFGFGLFMLALAGWQAQALTTNLTVTRSFPPAVDLFVGLVLITFGWRGVRVELARYSR